MKRRKAQFGQVISGYVDPTPEGLNRSYQRHMDNLIQNEALRRQSAQLQAAPFEGDEQMRRDLLKSTDAALQAVSQEASKNSYGNLSNFTTSVLRAATLYEKGAAPITQNLQKYQTYQQSLKDQVEKGEIDAEDYQINLGLSTKDYKGLQINAQGEVENYFGGITAWQNPDLLGMIDKAIKNISIDGDTTVTNILGQGPNGMYDVETTQGIKQIHPDKVRAALAGVFNDPRVVGYYGRKAEGRVAFMDDTTVKETLGTKVSELKKLAAEETDEDRRAGIERQIGTLQGAVDSNNTEEMRQTLRSTMRQDMLDTYENAAVAGKQKLETVYKRDVSYNPIYMKQLEAELSGAAGGTQAGVVFTEPGVAYTRPGGGNAHEYSMEIMEKTDSFAELIKQRDEAIAKGAPESELRLLDTQLENMQRSIRADNLIFKTLYGKSYSEIINTPEYKELQSKLRGNMFHTHEGGAGALEALGEGIYSLFHSVIGGELGMEAPMGTASDIKDAYFEYAETQRAMRDFFEAQGLPDDPRGETGTMSIDYVPLSGMGVKTSNATAIEKDLKDKFAMGFEDNMRVIDPKTGKIVEASEVFDIPMEDVAYDGVLFSRSTPMTMMPEHMLIQWKGKKDSDNKDKSGTIMVPLGPATGVSIPSLDRYYQQPSVKLIGELEYYKIVAGDIQQNLQLDWAGYSPTEGALQGYMMYDLQNGWVDIYDFDNNQMGSRMSISDPTFHGVVDKNKIELR